MTHLSGPKRVRLELEWTILRTLITEGIKITIHPKKKEVNMATQNIRIWTMTSLI